MKALKNLCLLMLVIGFGSLKSQTITYGSNSNEIMNLSNGNLFVVLSGDEKFDKLVQSSITNYWKHNKDFKAINASEIENLISDEKNYFISIMTYGVGTSMIIGSGKNTGKQELVFFNGGKKKLSAYSYGMMIATIPIILENIKFCPSQTDYLIKSLSDGIQIVIDNKIEGLSGKVMYAVLKDLRKKTSLLKNKTLLIDKEIIINEDVLAKYKYKYKVLSSSEIASIVETNSTEYCILSTGYYPFKQLFIHDFESKEVVYGISTQGSLDIGVKDFIKLNEIIEGKEIEKK